MATAWREASEALYWECYCPACHPEAFPSLSAERLHEGHVAVRFNDHVGPMIYTITVEGIDWTDATFEAVAGHDGWAWVASRNMQGYKHRCLCGAGTCQRVITGVVEVRGERRASSGPPRG